MDLNALRAAYAAKMDAARKLAAEWNGKEDQMPADVDQKLQGMMGECDTLQARIALAEKMGGHAAYLGQQPQPEAAHLGFRPATRDEGTPEVDAKAYREIEVKTIFGDSKKFRYHVPLNVQTKGYDASFEAYIRKGLFDMGPLDRKTLTTGVDSAGGFGVPEDWHAQIIRKVATGAVMRQLCRVIQTSRDVAKWPKLNYSTDDKYTSGVRFTWTGELPASSTIHRSTEPVFGLANIPVFTSMASMPFSNDTLEDNVFDLLGIATDLFSEAYMLGEEDAFLTGDGITKPLGLLNGAGTASGIAAVVSGDANTFTYDGVVNLEAALPAQYERNARFMAAKATYAALRKLKNTLNEPLWPVIDQYGSLGVTPANILGYPIAKSEFAPAVATNAFPLILGDFGGYIIVDRVGLSVQRLDELYAETNITVLLARKRVGGQLVEPYRLKVQKIAAS